MLTETSVPGSDDWWLMRLMHKLGDGLPRMHRLTSYRDGDALLPDNAWDVGTRESYRRFMRRSRLHVVETLRNAKTDRQRVIGFRTAALGDVDGDLEAWKLWNRNRMKVQSRPFFNDLGDYGSASIVTMKRDGFQPASALWQVRNEWTTITEQNGLMPWLTEAGITVGYDQQAGADVVILYRPGYFRVASRNARVSTLPKDGTTWRPGPGWDWVGGPVATPDTPDALLQTSRTVDGKGIYEKHLDTVDRINEITLNALTLIITQAFRQRGVKGNLPERYPEGHPRAGEVIDYDELFKAGPAALWLIPTGADIWESTAVDVRPIYDARRDELKVLCSLTATPQDVFDGDSQNQSAMGAQISREPLYHAVRSMNDQAEVAIAQALAQAFQIEGDEVRADVASIEVMWDKITPATLAEKAEAASKYKAGGATQRFIDSEVFEMTPAQMRQADEDRSTELFQAAVAEAGAAGVTAT